MCLFAACSPVRVINVASLAHTFGRINFDDLMSTKSYDAWTAYGESTTAAAAAAATVDTTRSRCCV
jgi:hypothetical protein